MLPRKITAKFKIELSKIFPTFGSLKFEVTMMRKSKNIDDAFLHYKKAMANPGFDYNTSHISKIQMSQSTDFSSMFYAMESFMGSLRERPEDKYSGITEMYSHASMKKLKNRKLYLIALNFNALLGA